MLSRSETPNQQCTVLFSSKPLIHYPYVFVTFHHTKFSQEEGSGQYSSLDNYEVSVSQCCCLMCFSRRWKVVRTRWINREIKSFKEQLTLNIANSHILVFASEISIVLHFETSFATILIIDNKRLIASWFTECRNVWMFNEGGRGPVKASLESSNIDSRVCEFRFRWR